MATRLPKVKFHQSSPRGISEFPRLLTYSKCRAVATLVSNCREALEGVRPCTWGTLGSLYAAEMTAPPQLCRWSPPLIFPHLYPLARDHVQLGGNYIHLVGRAVDTQMRVS